MPKREWPEVLRRAESELGRDELARVDSVTVDNVDLWLEDGRVVNASNLEDAVEKAATELVPVWVDTSVVILGRADGRRFVLDVKGLTAKTFSWLNP